MNTTLNQLEMDLIEFLSHKSGRPRDALKDVFLETREEFKFGSSAYRYFCDRAHNLFRIIYDDKDEKNLIDAYRYHAFMHMLRMSSYSYPPPRDVVRNFEDLIAAFARIFKLFVSFDAGKLKTVLTKKLAGWTRRSIEESKDIKCNMHASIAKRLIDRLDKPPVVVDYGCGMGYISFEIAKLNKTSKIFLLDIDTIILEFALFRFTKHGFEAQTIPIVKDLPAYPKLPPHNICIVMSVMEHIVNPLAAYQNIYDSLERGGIIYGNFGDTRREMFHVSSDLSQLRRRIAADFQEIGECCYKKP